MSFLTLDDVSLTIGEKVILQPTSLVIGERDFTTLLGPSGSGKTTLLMLIAGFLQPTRGRILLRGRDITRLHPRKRNFGVVFQSYSLFPNMTVRENIAFPLKIRGLAAADRRRRVEEIAALVDLTQHLDKVPARLSGGQQQRVALARCLVYTPDLILLDEPLSALDVQLRLRMQGELKRLHRETQATIVNVTHDQQEALSISSRIVVMDHGRLVEQGSPDRVYFDPEQRFTAQFLGDGNLWPVTPSDGRCLLPGFEPPLRLEGAGLAHRFATAKPEHLRIAPAGQDGPLLPGWVTEVSFAGESLLIEVETARGALRIKQRAEAGAAPEIGEMVRIAVDPRHLRLVADDAGQP